MKNLMLILLVIIGGCSIEKGNSEFKYLYEQAGNRIQDSEYSQDITCWNCPPLENAPLEKDIVLKTDNTTPSNKLITKKYSEDILLRYGILRMCLANISMVCDIECIRKINDDEYYCILNSNEGGTMYLLFTRDEGGNLSIVKDSHIWYVKNETKKSDFEELKVNYATVNDVKEVDPYGNYITDLAPYLGIVMEYQTSSHITIDGYKIIVKYEWQDIKSNFVVTGIEYEQSDIGSIYDKLLIIDRPSC